MAVIHNSIEGISDQLNQMAAHEAGLRKQLAAATEAREALTAQIFRDLDIQKSAIEQQVLRLQFEAGDQTVERDETAGNGGGGYRRIDKAFNHPPVNFALREQTVSNMATAHAAYRSSNPQ